MECVFNLPNPQDNEQSYRSSPWKQSVLKLQNILNDSVWVHMKEVILWKVAQTLGD